MKTLKTIGSFLCMGLIGGSLMTSCLSEDTFGEESGKVTGKEINVKFSLQMPSANNTPTTYAISEIDENHVEDIDILAFKPVTVSPSNPSGWAFDYQAQVSGEKIVSKSGYTKKEVKEFTVTLIKRTEQQTLVVLANVRSQITALGEIAEGTDKVELLARLELTNYGKWHANNNQSDTVSNKTFTPFPMWGEKSLQINDATTSISNISLLRSIARVDVVLATDSLPPVNNFTLDIIHIYNSKNKGQIVPDAVNLQTVAKVKAATLPAGDINNGNPLGYPVPLGMNKLFERTIYLFEAKGTTEDKASEATCIVVGGTFGTDTKTTYYRLDFLKKQTTDTYYRDILRNHRYRANITKVSGRGYDTPDDAFNSKAINMEAEITEWDDGGMGDVVFDGQYALSVDPTEFNFSSDAFNAPVDANAFSIFTDYPTGWTIPAANIVDATTGTAITWIKVMKGAAPGTVTVGGVADTKASLWLKVDTNTTGAARSAKVIVAAGRLRYPVIVNQSINPKKVAIFNFVKYTNINGTGSSVPPSGGQIMATVNTNMGWKLKTSISGIEASMAEPAGIAASNYGLSIQIPALADIWASDPISTKVWIEYAGMKSEETTYTQVRYRIGFSGAPTSVNSSGDNVTLTLTGYFPAMNFRTVDAVDTSKVVSNVVACTATGNESTDESSNVTMVVSVNSSGANRNIKFQYEKYDGVWVDIATASQDWSGFRLPTGRIIAPPGILGVGATTGRLTLDGSKEYDDEGPMKGTAGETVYIVYFKWGSTIAINGDAGGYTTAKVAWVPPGFTGSASSGNLSSMNTIPYGTYSLSPSALPIQDNEKALGDPCILATRDGTIGNYRMPVGVSSYEDFVAGAWVASYKGVAGRWSSDMSQFYPAAGLRNPDNTGAVDNEYIHGYYWSSSTFNNINSRNLYFTGTSSYPTNNQLRYKGMPIRCIPNN